MTSCRAVVSAPGARCTHVQDRPGSISVTFQASAPIPGCLITNRLPTPRPVPSRPTSDVTDAVHSGQRSTSLNTSHTSCAGASISMLSSVIMYQMVHEAGDGVRGGYDVDPRVFR